MLKPRPNEGNGSMPIRLGLLSGWNKLVITGGPYDYFQPGEEWFGICVRSERVPERGVGHHLPIEDFEVPEDDGAVSEALKAAFTAALKGRKVYVGCMGGVGRTGLFLALMAKVAGVENPVRYVRENFIPHAIETERQQAYVAKFDVWPVSQWLRSAGWKARFGKL